MAQYDCFAGGEMRGQMFTQINRAVLAAGAADGHCQVTAIIALECG